MIKLGTQFSEHVLNFSQKFLKIPQNYTENVSEFLLLAAVFAKIIPKIDSNFSQNFVDVLSPDFPDSTYLLKI